MENRKLMIGIPTKNHSKYIQYYLSRVLPAAKEEYIDSWIYDSSEDDLTKKVVFAIPYSEDLANNFKKLNNIRLRYKSNIYKCIDFNNLEALDKVIELTCEAI